MEKIDIIDEAPYGDNPYIDPELCPKDDMDADECLTKINNWERFRKFWLDFYAKKIEEVSQKCDRNIAYNRRKLKDYFSTVPHKSTKTQEIYDLPSGKLAMVYKKPSLVPDRQAILDRFKASGDKEFIKTKTTEDIDWNGYKERLFISEDGKTVLDKETGEIVKDVSIKVEDPEFKATPKKETEGEEDVREEAV